MVDSHEGDMTLKIRSAELGDVDQLTDLHRICYPLPELSPENRRETYTNNPRCSLEDVLVAFIGSKLVASLIAYHFTQFQEEVEIPVVGIANVLVTPERRREGIAGELIQKTLELFEEQDVPASILYPFEHKFYRHLGWGYATEIRQYCLKTEQIQEYEDIFEEDDLKAELLNSDQLPHLMNFYDSQARKYNGLLKRNERYWKEKIISPPRQLVIARYNGEIIGYLAYFLQKVSSDNSFIQEMVIPEWMAPTLDARDALLCFLSRQSDQVDRLRFFLGTDEPLHLWVVDPRSADRKMVNRLYAETATLCSGMMYRLVNLKSAFEGGRPFNGVKGELTIESEDELLGDRRLILTFNGKGAVSSEAKSQSNHLLRGPVDVLSQIFCGYMTAEQAFELDLVEFEGKDTLEFCQHAFAMPPPRCFDLF